MKIDLNHIATLKDRLRDTIMRRGLCAISKATNTKVHTYEIKTSQIMMSTITIQYTMILDQATQSAIVGTKHLVLSFW